MKTKNLMLQKVSKQRNKALAIYIASVSAFMVTYSVFAAFQYL